MDSNKQFQDIFAKRLKSLRIDSDLLQKDLAKVLGVTPAAIGMYENGRRFPDVDILNNIASYFDVSADYLLGRTDVRNNDPNEIRTIAAHANQSLTEKEIEKIEEYVRFLKSQREDN